MIHFLEIVYRWVDFSFGQVTKRRRSVVGGNCRQYVWSDN